MKLSVKIEVNAEQLERLSQRGVTMLGGREEPRKSWTDKERAQMARAYLAGVLEKEIGSILGTSN